MQAMTSWIRIATNRCSGKYTGGICSYLSVLGGILGWNITRRVYTIASPPNENMEQKVNQWKMWHSVSEFSLHCVLVQGEVFVVAEPLEQLWNSWSVQTPGHCPNARVLVDWKRQINTSSITRSIPHPMRPMLFQPVFDIQNQSFQSNS